MRTTAGTGAIALLLFAGLGCRASPLADRFEAVSKDISSARAAGAPDYAPRDYYGARYALDLAKDAEASAVDAREDAEAAREAAMADLASVQKLLADREAALEEAQKRLADAEARVLKLERRQAELRRRGVTEQEIDRALGDELALAELDASASRAAIKTGEAELELLALRKQECEKRIAAANEAIAVAGQQLLHANALCEKAGASARMAEAHAIARRKAELKVR